jgi:hypothetical protein
MVRVAEMALIHAGLSAPTDCMPGVSPDDEFGSDVRFAIWRYSPALEFPVQA